MAAGRVRDPRIGTVLAGKWKIEARVGVGGVATVYAARHRKGARVAIKILNPEVVGDQDVRARFRREGYAANAVEHPGVVRVLDDGKTEDGTPFLVMDLLEGELADDRRIRFGGRLPLSEVLLVGDRVLDVLAAAHDKGVIHRDVKPENIFLCSDGAVKLLDFGVARMENDRGRLMTRTGVLVGTPEFMSPEQANGVPGAVDALTDIWSTGATLFALASGESVHDADTLPLQILAAAARPARSLGSVAHDMPRAFVDVVDKALAYAKMDRWPDARSMQRALAVAARLSAVTAVAQEEDPTAVMADREPRTHRELDDEELKPTLRVAPDEHPELDDEEFKPTVRVQSPPMPGDAPPPFGAPFAPAPLHPHAAYELAPRAAPMSERTLAALTAARYRVVHVWLPIVPDWIKWVSLGAVIALFWIFVILAVRACVM